MQVPKQPEEPVKEPVAPVQPVQADPGPQVPTTSADPEAQQQPPAPQMAKTAAVHQALNRPQTIQLQDFGANVFFRGRANFRSVCGSKFKFRHTLSLSMSRVCNEKIQIELHLGLVGFCELSQSLG